MSVILVVQPDPSQGKVLHDVARRVGAELVLVDSTKRAIEAIGRTIPDLILLSALLSPREEDKLMARLRSLEGASHLQTLTLPEFRRDGEGLKPRKLGFGFRRKQKASVAVGCDPVAFAEEIVAHLARAHEIRTRPAQPATMRTVIAPAIEPMIAPAGVDAEPEPLVELEQFASIPFMPEPIVEAQAPELPAIESSVFDQPIIEAEPQPVEPSISEPQTFERLTYEPPTFESPTYEPANFEPPNFELANFEPTNSNSVEVPTSSKVPAASIDEDEIDQLVRQLGLDVRLVEIEDVVPPAVGTAAEAEAAFDFSAALDRARVDAEERRAADIAQLQAETEAIRAAAIVEARAAAEREAREALASDLARVQAEAEAMREAAITEARAAAEREARETLNAEIARVRSETEVTVADALNKVKVEAEEGERIRAEAERMRVEAQEAFAAELARVRAEVERNLAVQLDAARADAERMRASEAAAIHERTAVEAQLKSELDRLRFASAQARKADESVTKRAAEQIKRLEGELGRVRAKAEERQVAELEEIKTQMAELREAAAQHVRDAAAEAVAAEVARASAQVASLKPREGGPAAPKPREGGQTAVIAQFPTRVVAQIDESHEEGVERLSRDYLSLWQPTPEPVAVEEPVQADEEPEEPVSIGPELRRHAKWVLPVAACLLLVTNTGTAISTVARFVGPGKPPALTVEPVNAEPFIEVVEKRVGRVRVESTPAGAEAIVDGRSYGKTPITIPDLEVGVHTLVLKSRAGLIRRKVTVNANETTLLSEAIFSGWLAIFSPVPVNVVIDGKPVSLTDNGRVMTSPGKHVVELISERFNYRATETLEVRPGETTAHTLSVPTGTVRVTAPVGAEVRIDGQPAIGVPAEGLAVAIGSHEISATLPERGERRVAVDVRHGALTEVTLRFDQ